MSPSCVCYPQPGKAKSRLVLEAFATGSGGRVAAQSAALEGAASAFYGVVGIEPLLRVAMSGEWFYGDNAFFDRARGRFFRFARNRFQIAEPPPPDWVRLKSLEIVISPWRAGGTHIVVVEQSEHFLSLVGASSWLERTLAELAGATARRLRIRRWRRDKDNAAATLQADLAGAWALVTHTSAAANEALIAGVPVFVTGPCAASPMASGPLDRIERPRRPDGREAWAAGLAAAQWTLDEIRAGKAWETLRESHGAG